MQNYFKIPPKMPVVTNASSVFVCYLSSPIPWVIFSPHLYLTLFWPNLNSPFLSFLKLAFAIRIFLFVVVHQTTNQSKSSNLYSSLQCSLHHKDSIWFVIEHTAWILLLFSQFRTILDTYMSLPAQSQEGTLLTRTS